MFTSITVVGTGLLVFWALWLVIANTAKAERIAELTQQRDHMADLVLDQQRQAAWDEEQRQDRADEFCQQQDDDLAQGLLWENTIK